MNLSTSHGLALSDIADAMSVELKGNGNVLITGVNSPQDAKRGEIAYLTNERLVEAAQQSYASAFFVPTYFPQLHVPQLITPHPQYVFVQLIQRFFPSPLPNRGIANEVALGSDVTIGEEVSIGPFVTLGNRVRIGDRVTLYPGVHLGDDVTVGCDSILYPRVTVLDRCEVGKHVIIHAGTVIGSDGFGYVQHEGRHHKIPQRGTVVIEDHVELGANVTIDRATFGQTRIKQGCKIDNQVQIAHNVTMEEHCIVVAQVGIAGSTKVGKYVMIGGQAGLIDHLTIGDRAMIAAGAGIEKSVEPGAIMSGWPAKRHEVSLRTHVLVQRLPELHQQIAAMEKRLATLENAKGKTRKPKSKRK